MKFIDLDWACLDGQMTYPYYLNHITVNWPEGVATGQPVRQAHDAEFIRHLHSDSW